MLVMTGLGLQKSQDVRPLLVHQRFAFATIPWEGPCRSGQG